MLGPAAPQLRGHSGQRSVDQPQDHVAVGLACLAHGREAVDCGAARKADDYRPRVPRSLPHRWTPNCPKTKKISAVNANTTASKTYPSAVWLNPRVRKKDSVREKR